MLDVYEVHSPERFILTIDELTKKPEFQEEIG
jgi:NADH-quinone oxidoreductase subunit I